MSISPIAAARTPAAIGIELILNHYEGMEELSWHAQVQLATPADPTFADPVVDADSSDSQTGWYWRNEQLDATNLGLVAVPSGGMATQLSQARAYGRVGTAIYFLQAADLANLSAGQVLLVRGRQSASGGESWGDWAYLGPVTVGG